MASAATTLDVVTVLERRPRERLGDPIREEHA
jgi:hypothetical protein